MASLVLNGNTSGSVTISSPAVSGTTTLTLPTTTSTLAINGPAFSVYPSASTQSVSASTWTKVTFDVEEFDTNNNFASNRFTPTVAGYYQISARINFGTTLISNGNIAIYKNGSAYKRGSFLNASATSGEQATIVSSLVYCNGSTDYVEIYGNVNGTTPLFYGSDTLSTYFNGSMVRGA